MKCQWEWPPSLPHSCLRNIDILLHKQATQSNHICPNCTSLIVNFPSEESKTQEMLTKEALIRFYLSFQVHQYGWQSTRTASHCSISIQCNSWVRLLKYQVDSNTLSRNPVQSQFSGATHFSGITKPLFNSSKFLNSKELLSYQRNSVVKNKYY